MLLLENDYLLRKYAISGVDADELYGSRGDSGALLE